MRILVDEIVWHAVLEMLAANYEYSHEGTHLEEHV